MKVNSKKIEIGKMYQQSNMWFVRIVFICLFPSNLLVPQETQAQNSSDSLRVLNQIAFTVGERLVYDVDYSFITAGEAVFTVQSLQMFEGHESYQITFTVKSTPAFSWLYRVEDWYETIVDRAGIFPWRYTQHIREGKYKNDFEAKFDQINNIATTDKGQYQIPSYVHDVVSAFYYTRTLDLVHRKPGEKIFLQNFYRDSTYVLAVKFLGFQQVSVAAGTFNCIVIEPLMKEGGLFKNEGRVIIWLSNDDRKIPVKVSTKVVVGSIDAELRKYSGINGPITAKVN